MFDEPNEGQEGQEERALDPQRRAEEKSSEFRVHAEICAVFEATRKFDAELNGSLDADLARDMQKRMARLEKAKSPDTPVLPAASAGEAADLLSLAKARGASANDYHIHRRPGEVMVVRWLEGEQVESFYDRMQAHFDVAMGDFREDQRQAHGWRQDADTLAYLDALDKLEVRTADRYLRDAIRKHNLFVLSTVTADEIDILFLSDHVMGVGPESLVGPAAAPPDEPTEQDRAWFFRLFSLRGMDQGVERMCFFAYLQKTEDTFDIE